MVALMKVVGAKPMTKTQINAYVKSRLAKGVASAGKFIVGRLRFTVGQQAPRRRSRSSESGWVATTPATPLAPLRRVSGDGQKSIFWAKSQTGGLKLGAHKWYMLYWEGHKNRLPKTKWHQWLRPTVDKYLPEMIKIVGKETRASK